MRWRRPGGLVIKHAIKQVDRLLSNDGIDVWGSFAHWVPYQVSARQDILVAMDWTEFNHDGAVPEVIELGVSGFIVGSVDEAVAAVREAAGLNRLLVRRAFERRFTVEAMARAYLDIYRHLPGQRLRPLSNWKPVAARPPSRRPTAPGTIRVEGLMRDPQADDVAHAHQAPRLNTRIDRGVRLS